MLFTSPFDIGNRSLSLFYSSFLYIFLHNKKYQRNAHGFIVARRFMFEDRKDAICGRNKNIISARFSSRSVKRDPGTLEKTQRGKRRVLFCVSVQFRFFRFYRRQQRDVVVRILLSVTISAIAPNPNLKTIDRTQQHLFFNATRSDPLCLNDRERRRAGIVTQSFYNASSSMCVTHCPLNVFLKPFISATLMGGLFQRKITRKDTHRGIKTHACVCVCLCNGQM